MPSLSSLAKKLRKVTMSLTTRDSDDSSRSDVDFEKEVETAFNVQRNSRVLGPDPIHVPADGKVDVERAIPAATDSQRGFDWDGPDDPDNPYNWSPWLRYWHMVPPSLISFSCTFGSSIYTPAVPEIQAIFGVGTTAALLPLSLYVLALGLGPVIAAPLSEMYGRKVVYLASAPFGALFTLGAGFSPTFAGLLILRFLAGAAFSPALAIGAGTNADCNPPHQRAILTAIYIFSPFCGPALGPVIGSFVAVRKGWQWTQWTIIFFAIFSWITALFTRETYKPQILARRRKALGIPGPPPKGPPAQRLKMVLTVTLFRPVHMLCTEPIVGFFSLYIAFNFGVMFTFFAAFPWIFRTEYGFNLEQSGLVFLALGVGSTLAVLTHILSDKYYYQKQYRLSHEQGREGVVAPEHRLYPAVLGSFGLPIGLFWFAWTARSDVSWASPIVAAIPFAWGNLSIFISAAMYLVDTYQSLTAASAIAANGLLRYGLGAAFPLFALQMYQGLGIAWATSLLAFITVAMLPIPWILFKFGPQIRGRSSYDTVKA